MRWSWEGGVASHQEPAPDERTDVSQDDTQLIDVRERRVGFHEHSVRRQPVRFKGAPRNLAVSSQWGVWVRPGKGCGTRGRWREGGMRSGGRGTPAASRLGQAAGHRQPSQSRPNSTNWENKRWDTIALPPFMVVKRGALYPFCRLLHYPHDRGTRPGVCPADEGPAPAGLCHAQAP